MLFGIDIDYWYAGLLIIILFCLGLVAISWIVNEVRNWRRRSKEHL